MGNFLSKYAGKIVFWLVVTILTIGFCWVVNYFWQKRKGS